MRFARRFLIVIIFFALYLISTVPIGLFLYSVKSNSDINIFTKTGFHAYQACLAEQIEAIDWQ